MLIFSIRQKDKYCLPVTALNSFTALGGEGGGRGTGGGGGGGDGDVLTAVEYQHYELRRHAACLVSATVSKKHSGSIFKSEKWYQRFGVICCLHHQGKRMVRTFRRNLLHPSSDKEIYFSNSTYK
jgi:hypothetical protein